MYCKTCGQSNPDWSNYCSHDGNQIGHNPPVQSLFIKTNETNFCPHCGNGVNMVDQYCTSCGQSLLKYSKPQPSMEMNPEPIVQERMEPAAAPAAFFTSLLSKGLLKKVFIPAIVAFAIMLILNYLSFAPINQFYEGIFEDSLGSTPAEFAQEITEEYGSHVEVPDKLFGFTDNVMMSHILSPTYQLKLDVNTYFEEIHGTADLDISFALIAYILFPLIGLFVGGILYRKNNPEISFKSFLSGSFGIGLIYTLLLTALSFFSGFDYQLNLSKSGERVSIDLGTNYPLFQTIVKGFLFGFIFSMLGMLFSINYRRVTKHLEKFIPYGNAVHQGFAAFVRGFISFSIIFVGYLFGKMNDLKEIIGSLHVPELPELLEKTSYAIGLFGIQVSSIFYSMLHFSPLSFHLKADGESSGIQYSIFSGFKFTGEAMNGDLIQLEYFFNLFDIDLYFKLAMVIPVIFLLFAGYSMAKANQFSLKSLAISSAVYSLFMVALASFSILNVDGVAEAVEEGKQMFQLSLTVSLIKVFIGSFGLSFAAGYGGMYLKKIFQK